MPLLRYLASVFIDVFGVTRPSAETRDRAALYIFLLLLSVVAAVFLVGILAARVLVR